MVDVSAVSNNCSAAEASADRWDTLVVGAGPAGAMAARQLARLGARVLLIDRSEFPRDKVCGCCLNSAALGVLERVGLADLADERGAVRLLNFELSVGGRSACVTLPGGAVLSRRRFDAALVRSAIDAGARFVGGARAKGVHISETGAQVEIETATDRATISAAAVVAADGLSGDFVRRVPGVRTSEATHARVGGAASLEFESRDYQSRGIYMAVARGGYVGVVRLEDDQLDVAAAFDPTFVRDSGGLAAAAASVLKRAGLPPIDRLEAARWRGTPLLTRTTRVDCPRLFVVGDSAGYVEPFTGEGMACALAGGAMVGRVIANELGSDLKAAQKEWQGEYQRKIEPRHRRCRRVTLLLRSTMLASAAVSIVRLAPVLARPLVRGLNRPIPG